MSLKIQNPDISRHHRMAWSFAMLVLLAPGFATRAADLVSLCRDRAAIERIYYNHRLGEKPPFEQVLPGVTVEKLVRQDLTKEAALKKVYGLEITATALDAEVRRIDTTTRAPEILAEIKAALGKNQLRFADSFARPILVERLLRGKFDNDDALHAPQRHQVEQLRNELLAAKTNRVDYDKLLTLLKRGHSSVVTEMTWQLSARLVQTNAPAADEIEIKKRFGADAQVLSSPHAGEEAGRKFYFEELPGDLQNVLRVQLRHPGDLSAVIETPGGFLLYLTKEKTAALLSVAGLFQPKRSYEQWLEEQGGNEP